MHAVVRRYEGASALNDLLAQRSQDVERLLSDVPGFVAHYAIRALLLDAADPAGYDPDRMSFIKGLRVVRRQVTDQAAITP